MTTDLCAFDGKPCHVGAGTDDAHWRCGTVQCGLVASPPPPVERETELQRLRRERTAADVVEMREWCSLVVARGDREGWKPATTVSIGFDRIRRLLPILCGSAENGHG